MAEKKATRKVLDFTNVKDRGNVNPVRVDEGDYKMKILSVSEETSSKGNDQWLFILQLEGRANATYPYYCGFDTNQLWKVRNLFVASGVQVPKKKVGVDPNKIIGKFVGATLVDDEYEGKMKSVIESVFPVSDLPAAPKSRKAATKKDEPEDVEEDVEDEDIEEDVDDELEVDDL